MLKKLFAAVVLSVPLSTMAVAEDAGRVLVVVGHGETSAQPDMAQVRLGVTYQDPDANVAMNRVSDDVRQVFETLDAFDIAPRDIQTSSLRLDPVWDNRRSGSNEPPRISGFVARNEVTVRLRDFTRLGEVLDRLLRSGANQFSGVSFGVETPDPLIDEARRQAVADAARKASLYAQAAGVQLGSVLEIREPGTGPAPGPRMSRMEPVMAEAAMPVAGGELTFSAQVTIVYGIAK